MKTITSAAQMQKAILAAKNKNTIGFVPTMGFLHDGHLKLVEVAKKKSDITVVSIFVNPTQFGPKEDLSRYPRDLKGDLQKLKQAGVDFVFVPKDSEIYPDGFQTVVDVREITRYLCGASRPGHFQGVATIVTKLFNIVQPDVAVFGQKDFQQLKVIQTLTRDLNLPVKIIGVPTVREKDGLALSSRNKYLTAEDRVLALSLSRGLKAIREACQKRELNSDEMKDIFLSHLPDSNRVALDYIECLNAETLGPLPRYKKGQTLTAAAVFVGNTRLIDNLVF